MTLDEAIAKAKADGDVQLAEWLRQARGADAAARWYREKLRNANRTIRKLLTENANLRKLVDGWDFCSKTKKPTFDECVGCPLFEQSPHGYRCTRSELMRKVGVVE